MEDDSIKRLNVQDTGSVQSVLSNATLCKFIYDVMAYFSENGYDTCTKDIMFKTSENNWKIKDDKNSIFLTGMFIETSLEQIKLRNSTHERWFEQSININGKNLYLSTQWNEPELRKNGNPFQLSFQSFKRLIEYYYKPYFVIKENGIFILKKNGEDTNRGIIETMINIKNVDEIQQIYFGAPGTGKSYTIKKETKGQSVFRTTFHPDSDYSTFVGAYKPTTIEVPIRDVTGKKVYEEHVEVKEDRVVYRFVQQAFIKAYVQAWEYYSKAQDINSAKPQFLIIEEINRGNCAQIFGDLFQLLDRNDYGFSEYPIVADADLRNELGKTFKELDIICKEDIVSMYDDYEGDVVNDVLNGKILLLPNNLYIWATMNTSDQSLFPIDSAFKRRWDWKYIPIEDARKDWVIEVGGLRYDWWSFLKKINDEIGDVTSSEDKKLGYYFCKAKDGVISAERFVSKVIFYLWNDVFKDYGFDKDYLKDENGGNLTFDRFYGGNGGAINNEMVKYFLDKLGVEGVDSEVALNEDELDDEEEELDDNLKSSTARLRIRFEDGTEFYEKIQFDSYFEALKKIGIEKVEAIAAGMKYSRRGCPLVSTIKHEPVLNDGYQYVEEHGYYVIKGLKVETMINFLNQISEEEHLNLKIDRV